MKLAHLPTPLCPHRYCRTVHTAFTAAACVGLLRGMLEAAWTMLTLFLVGMVVGRMVNRLVTRRSTLEEVLEDRAQRELNAHDEARHRALGMENADPLRRSRTVFAGGLTVRRGWARVALATDLLFLVGAVLWAAMPRSDESVTVPSLMEMLVVLPVSCGILALSLWAHKNATKPRRKRRAWAWGRAPAGART